MWKKDFNFQNQKIILEKGHVAQNASSSCVIRWNDTVILVTLCVSENPIDANFVPLSVDFQENLFSANKIPGGFTRREGKPSDFAVLSGRLIDRSIRNLFPKDFRHEVQVFINPLSCDYSIDIAVASILATSFVLNFSSLPINKPFASVVIGYVDNKFLINPTPSDLEKSTLELFLSGNEDKITMIEVSAHELSEDKLLEAIQLGHKKIVELIQVQKQIFSEIIFNKKEYQKNNLTNLEIDFSKIVEQEFLTKIEKVLTFKESRERYSVFASLEKEVLKFFQKKYKDAGLPDDWKTTTLDALNKLLHSKVRSWMLQKGKRLDGRAFDDLRELKAQVDYLPNVHGSALFSRGMTQSLSVVTLGSLNKNKILDDLSQKEKSYFLHHYKFLPFSMGLVQKRFNLSRREIGHGFLGHKALLPLIPNINDFPYTIRVASEVLSADGSTSQASICSASLALCSAGVPLKNPVAGVAIGLLKEDDNYHLLSDIQAWEDFYGDMDFKIAGTEKGICSVQLDLKIDGLPFAVIKKALDKGYQDRLKILKVMKDALPAPRSTLPNSALKFEKLFIAEENISALIGPSGKNIKKIIADFQQPEIDIQEDGNVLIYHQNAQIIKQVKDHILNLFKPVQIGQVFEAWVNKITDYGIFIKTKDRNIKGLIHISTLSEKLKQNNKYKSLKMNQKITVKVISINEKKQINFHLLQF